MEELFEKEMEKEIPNYKKVLPDLVIWKLKGLFSRKITCKETEKRKLYEFNWKNGIKGIRDMFYLDDYAEFTNDKKMVLNMAKNN